MSGQVLLVSMIWIEVFQLSTRQSFIDYGKRIKHNRLGSNCICKSKAEDVAVSIRHVFGDEHI